MKHSLHYFVSLLSGEMVEVQTGVPVPNDVNSKLTGTQELQLVTKPKAGVNVSTNGQGEARLHGVMPLPVKAPSQPLYPQPAEQDSEMRLNLTK